MKLIVRLLMGEPFGLETAPWEKVRNLKKKVATVKPELVVEQMMIVYSGKILEDESTMQDSGIKDGDFVVATSQKPKAAKQPVADGPALPVPAQPPSPARAGSAASAASDTVPASPASPSTCGLTVASQASLAAASGEAPESGLAAIPRATPAVASEVSEAGGPDVTAVAASPAQAAEALPVPAVVPPRFGVAARPLRATSEALPTTTDSVRPAEAATSRERGHDRVAPAVVNAGTAGAAGGYPAGSRLPTVLRPRLAAAGPGAARGPAPPAARGAAALAAAEDAALGRLQGLGFDRATCLEAYLKCQKDEDLAASSLLEDIYAEDTVGTSALGATVHPSSPSAASPVAAKSPAPSGLPTGASQLQQLCNDPNFKELAKVVSEQPDMLDQLLEALELSDPSMARSIRENRREFLRMVLDSVGDTRPSAVAVMLEAARAAKAAAKAEPARAEPPAPAWVAPGARRPPPQAAAPAAARAPAAAAPPGPPGPAPEPRGPQEAPRAAPPGAGERTAQRSPPQAAEPAVARAQPPPTPPQPAPEPQKPAAPPQAATGTLLSAGEEATVSRLASTLGFERDLVRETFLACGRNEEVTASELFWVQDLQESAQRDAAEAQAQMVELPEPVPVPWHAESRWSCFTNARHLGDDLEYSGRTLDLDEAIQWAEEMSNCVGFTFDRWCNPPCVWFHSAVHEQDCVEGHEGFDLYVHKERFTASQNQEGVPVHAPGETVELTIADEQAVMRLAGLGFTTEAALEAYLACGRNEEYAGSVLFADPNDYVD